MSIEQAIHDRWAGDAPLSAILPASRLFTGQALSSPAMPYAVLTRQKTRAVLRTSSGTLIEDILVRLNLWTNDLDEGKEIAGHVSRLLDSASFAMTGGVVRDARAEDHAEEPQEDGSWNLRLEYRALVERYLG